MLARKLLPFLHGWCVNVVQTLYATPACSSSSRFALVTCILADHEMTLGIYASAQSQNRPYRRTRISSQLLTLRFIDLGRSWN